MSQPVTDMSNTDANDEESVDDEVESDLDDVEFLIDPTIAMMQLLVTKPVVQRMSLLVEQKRLMRY